MSRNQLVLLVILAVQIVLLAVGAGGRSAASVPTEARLFLPEIGSFGPTRIQIVDGDEEEGVLTLVRQGADWGIEEAGGYPAKGQRVADLVAKLQDLEVRRPAVSQPRYFHALKVATDDFERRVRIWGQGSDDAKVDFYLGTAPNYRTTHARRADQDEVYAVSDLGLYDFRTDSNGWASKMVSEDLFDEPTWFRLENATGALEFERGAEGWTLISGAFPDDRRLDPEKIDSLLRSANSVWIVEPVGRVDETAQGLVTPAVRMSFLLGPAPTPDETTGETPVDERRPLVLRVGGPVEGEPEQRYFNREDFGFTGAVRESSVRKLLDADLESLLAEPEEEEPEAAEDEPPAAEPEEDSGGE